MSTDEQKQTALVPVQSTALTKTGAKSLAARGRADLRAREEGEEWLKKGCEFRDHERYEEALACFERGIELNPNDAVLQFMLGLSFGNGIGAPLDVAKARTWYRSAAEQGLKEAQYNLGLMYYGFDDGPGARNNYEQAANWFRKAAKQGFEKAQNRLNLLLGEGIVVPQGNVEMRVAAEHGNKGAQRILGDWYRDGRGVPQDHAQASLWYLKAAEQGDADAKAALAAMAQSPIQDEDEIDLSAGFRPLSMATAIELHPDDIENLPLPLPPSARTYSELSDSQQEETIRGFEATKSNLQPSISDEESGVDQPSGSGMGATD
jgi:TPR repeat protein